MIAIAFLVVLPVIISVVYAGLQLFALSNARAIANDRYYQQGPVAVYFKSGLVRIGKDLYRPGMIRDVCGTPVIFAWKFKKQLWRASILVEGVPKNRYTFILPSLEKVREFKRRLTNALIDAEPLPIFSVAK